MKKLISIFLIVICFAMGVSILKTNPSSLEMFVNILNAIDKVVNFIFKGLLILGAISIPFAIIIFIKNFLKLGKPECSTNPAMRANVLKNMYFGFTTTAIIFGSAISIKVVFSIIIWILVHLI